MSALDKYIEWPRDNVINVNYIKTEEAFMKSYFVKHEKGYWLLRLDIKGKTETIQPSFQYIILGNVHLF